MNVFIVNKLKIYHFGKFVKFIQPPPRGQDYEGAGSIVTL